MAMDEGEAFHLAERLRSAIAAAEFEHGGKRHRVTVSIGVSSWRPAVGEDSEELVRLADSALYAAKQAGRDRVETARV